MTSAWSAQVKRKREAPTPSSVQKEKSTVPREKAEGRPPLGPAGARRCRRRVYRPVSSCSNAGRINNAQVHVWCCLQTTIRTQQWRRLLPSTLQRKDCLEKFRLKQTRGSPYKSFKQHWKFALWVYKSHHIVLHACDNHKIEVKSLCYSDVHVEVVLHWVYNNVSLIGTLLLLY